MDTSALVFDVETTGTDKRRDQIIELCVQFGLDDGSPSKVWRIRPDVEISPGAEAVHGISMADVAACPRFADVADEIRKMFEEATVWVGYNIAFDIEMVQAEYRRLGQAPLAMDQKTVIDAFRLWQRCEPRSLMDAHKRFVGQEFQAAHSALADVAATTRVLRGMLSHFDIAEDWQKIATICEPERARWVGPSHHVQWQENGMVALSFGRHAGIPLPLLASGPDGSYLRWMLGQDFPGHVHEICREALNGDGAKFSVWILERFGPPPAAQPERTSEVAA